IQRTRGSLTNVILNDLAGKAGPARFGEVTLEQGADPDLVLGFLFTVPLKPEPPGGENTARRQIGKVFIRRSFASAAQEVDFTDPDSQLDDQAKQANGGKSPIDFVERLPIRQDFVVEDQGAASPDARERSKIVVKLPIRIDPELLHNHAESLGYFQVFRQFPWEENPVMIADFLTPDLPFLDEPSVAETGTANWSGEGIAARLELKPSLPRSYKQVSGKFVVLQPKKSSDPRHVGIISQWDPGADKAAVKWYGNGPTANTEYTYYLVEMGKVAGGPFLYSDEFELEDRSFTRKDFVKQGFKPGETQIRYYVRMVPNGESNNLRTEAQKIRLGKWNPVKLFVPEREEFPHDLAIVWDAGSQIKEDKGQSSMGPGSLSIGGFGRIQIVSVRGESPDFPMYGERPLVSSDFELWASRKPLRQTGFYAGSESVEEIEKPVDSSSVTLKDVPMEKRLESVDHKFPVAVTDSTDRDTAQHFEIRDPDLLVPGYSYTFFVRPAKHAEIRLLTPLPVYLVRSLPRRWLSDVKTKPVDELEIIPESHAREALALEPVPLSTDRFAVDDFFKDGENRLRVNWHNLNISDGGVEIVFRDEDESTLVQLRQCEVMEARAFRQSKRDFSDASYWRVVDRQHNERVASFPTVLTIPGEIAPKDLIKYFYHKGLGNEDHFHNLTSAFDKLKA
ncbi:hypothetical protein ACFL2Q_20305, partial [Thermodesulfobacteriota bacterium]